MPEVVLLVEILLISAVFDLTVHCSLSLNSLLVKKLKAKAIVGLSAEIEKKRSITASNLPLFDLCQPI